MWNNEFYVIFLGYLFIFANSISENSCQSARRQTLALINNRWYKKRISFAAWSDLTAHHNIILQASKLPSRVEWVFSKQQVYLRSTLNRASYSWVPASWLTVNVRFICFGCVRLPNTVLDAMMWMGCVLGVKSIFNKFAHTIQISPATFTYKYLDAKNVWECLLN